MLVLPLLNFCVTRGRKKLFDFHKIVYNQRVLLRTNSKHILFSQPVYSYDQCHAKHYSSQGIFRKVKLSFKAASSCHNHPGHDRFFLLADDQSKVLKARTAASISAKLVNNTPKDIQPYLKLMRLDRPIGRFNFTLHNVEP
jgi:hypothetical protein